MLRCYLRMQRSRRDDKDTFPISSMVKGWMIPDAGNKSVVRGERIRGSGVLSARKRLKRPEEDAYWEGRGSRPNTGGSVEVFGGGRFGVVNGAFQCYF